MHGKLIPRPPSQLFFAAVEPMLFSTAAKKKAEAWVQFIGLR